jgi:hypothetical protein
MHSYYRLSRRYIKKGWRFLVSPRPKFNSFLNTLVAFAGLIIAVRTYYDQQESGPKQQEALDKSRAALENSSNALKMLLKTASKQQSSLDSNLKITSEMLAVMDEQWRQEQSRLSQKPNLYVAASLQGARVYSEGQLNKSVLTAKLIGGSIHCVFYVYNTGNFNANNVRFSIKSSNTQVNFERVDRNYRNKKRPIW